MEPSETYRIQRRLWERSLCGYETNLTYCLMPARYSPWFVPGEYEWGKYHRANHLDNDFVVTDVLLRTYPDFYICKYCRSIHYNSYWNICSEECSIASALENL